MTENNPLATVYSLSNAIAVSSTRGIVGAAASLGEAISADPILELEASSLSPLLDLAEEISVSSYQKVTSYQYSSYNIRKVYSSHTYLDADATTVPVFYGAPNVASYQKVTSYQSSSYNIRKVFSTHPYLDDDAIATPVLIDSQSAASYQKVTSYQSSSYNIRKVFFTNAYLDDDAIATPILIDSRSAASYQKVTSYPLYEYTIRKTILTDAYLDDDAIATPRLIGNKSIDSYQKVTSYPLYEYTIRHAIYTPIYLNSNATLTYEPKGEVGVDGYLKVTSYPLYEYTIREVIYNPIVIDSNATLTHGLRGDVEVDGYLKVTSYPLYEYTIRHAIYTPIYLESNATLTYSLATEKPVGSYQKVTSYSASTYVVKSVGSFSVSVSSNASVTPTFVSIFELIQLSNGTATCIVEDTKIYFSADLLVKSYPSFTITSYAQPTAEIIISSNASVNNSGGEVQNFSAHQRSGAGFTLPVYTPISFIAYQSSSSEMVYARYDEDLSFSCGETTSSDVDFVYTDYNTNLPSMYYGNPSFEVTNVSGKWKKVTGMDTLLKIEHGVSAKAMVKAYSSCPEEAISIRFKIASERSSPTGYFVLEDDGTWSPDNMIATVFVDDPGWYTLEWYVKVGRGARMDWIRLSGATLAHS